MPVIDVIPFHFQVGFMVEEAQGILYALLDTVLIDVIYGKRGFKVTVPYGVIQGIAVGRETGDIRLQKIAAIRIKIFEVMPEYLP